MKNVVLILGGVGVVLLCCCLLLALVVFGGIAYEVFQSPDFSLQPESGTTTETPVVIRPTEEIPAPSPAETQSPSGEQQHAKTESALHAGEDTLRTLQQAEIPINDLIDLAERLNGIEDIPRTVKPPAAPLEVGMRETMWMTNVDTNESFQVDVVLQYVTDHAYYWIEDGVSFDPDDLQTLAETFESKIYPTDRAFFGSEWTPGVDGDPHLYIIYARGLGFSLAGYFSSADEYHPLAHEYSNAHESFVLNADTVGLAETFTLGVLAHEFQHMIHWYRDRNETSWLNEGFSELAVFLNDYYMGGFDFLYASNPDMQLNDWPNDPSATSPHYGAGFLFLNYFLNRFGDQATQALVAHPENGMESVDAVLEMLGAADPQTGEAVRADDVFLDWVVTNYLGDGSIADGRYVYENYAEAPLVSATESVTTCPTETQTRDVHQYGADYIRIACSGTYTLRFEGSTQVGLLPVDAYSGEYAFWSNKGDESDMTLTRRFDFSQYSGPLTLTYWTWYDLEEDYDYLYVEASLDGEHWQILTTPSGTLEDPSGHSYGWGYNGLSGGDGRWIQEMVDISNYAGKKVYLRFEYVTDAAVNGEGFLLDDVAIPETGYFTDFETDAGGWEAAGFVRVRNLLPQTFRLALIRVGARTEVEYLTLNDDLSLEIPIKIGGDVDEVVLVVTGTTRYTRQKAAYRFEIVP